MFTKEEALKMAIEALETAFDLAFKEIAGSPSDEVLFEDALIACKEALAQPAQEPVYAIVADKHIQYDIDTGLLEIYNSKEQAEKNTFIGAEIKTVDVTSHPAPEQNEFARTKSCQECENLKHDLEGYMEANKALINREWQGLSNKEVMQLILINELDSSGDIGFYNLIEQALKEKNHVI